MREPRTADLRDADGGLERAADGGVLEVAVSCYKKT